MSRIRYNYYNIVATKTGDNTFIFRGTSNVPNLVLPNSDSYISTKLKINPSEGTIDIEHEQITNYSKKVIVTFPVKLTTDIEMGASKEINLNKIISKSIRFTINETKDAIRLRPETTSVTEGFCSPVSQQQIDNHFADIDATLAKKCDAPCNGNGSSSGVSDIDNMSQDAINALAAKLGISSFEDNGGELTCTPYVDNADNEQNPVGETVPLSASDKAQAAENSVYHQAAISVIMFIGILFLAFKIVGVCYNMIAGFLTARFLNGFEFLLLLLSLTIAIILFATQSKPSSDSDTATITKNATMSYVGVGIICFDALFGYIIYDYRRIAWLTAKDSGDPSEVSGFNAKFGARYSVFYFMTEGFIQMLKLFKQAIENLMSKKI